MPGVSATVEWKDHRRGPLPRIAGAALGRPLSLLYGLEIARRNRLYDRGKGVVTFDRPVISVGNLSAGGTGKTPMVQWLTGVLLAAGRQPCIAMRGYGAGAGRSDEAEVYRRAFPNVPVVAQANRIYGLLRLFHEQHNADAGEAGDAPHSDCILLDDGFQHRKIARDMDIVLIDATRPPFADRLLPAGWLREGVRSLKRATHIVVTHADSIPAADRSDLERRIAKVHGHPPIAITRHAWSGLTLHTAAGPAIDEAISALRGRRVFAACAIGNPGPFLRVCAAAAAGPLAGELVLRDHDPYRPATVERLADAARSAGAEFIVTTEKDWSKLADAPAAAWPCPIAVPTLTLEFVRGGEDLAHEAAAATARGIETDEEPEPAAHTGE